MTLGEKSILTISGYGRLPIRRELLHLEHPFVRSNIVLADTRLAIVTMLTATGKISQITHEATLTQHFNPLFSNNPVKIDSCG